MQKAGRVKHGDRLGPWLYGVAVKVARRLRDKSRRAPNCDPELAALLPDRDRPDPDADWLAHLDRELHALPAKFRDPMVLCELQGLTRTAAAERLRLREDTPDAGRPTARYDPANHRPAGGSRGRVFEEESHFFLAGTTGLTNPGMPSVYPFGGSREKSSSVSVGFQSN